MGLNHVKIAITEHIQYEGQTQDNIPHGQGVLKVKTINLMNNQEEESSSIKKPKFNKNQQSQLQNDFIEIKGLFNKGELVTCQTVIKGHKYVGEIKRGQFGGQGTLIDLKNGLVWQGNFQGGQLTKGKCIKGGQYECQGSFVEQNFSIRTLKGLSQKIQKQKIFEIFGPEGRFIWTSTKQSIEGTFEYGDLQGIGTYKYGNGDFYKGEFSNGYFKGQGQYTSAGNIFKSVVGTFYNSLVHSPEQRTGDSKIRVEFHNGDCYQGQFNNGQMHDKDGTYTFNNGMIYKGNIHFGKFSGQCEVKYPSSSQLEQYKGEICDGALHGLGVLEYKNGVILKGYFSNNMKNGPCLLIYGRRTWKCLYLMDKLEGEIVEISKTK